MSEEIERVFNKCEFKVGLFTLNTEQCKALLDDRIKEISTIIYNYLIQKISAENSKVHSEVLRIIKKLKHIP